jgi:predicted nuclease with TOPRIM domain
MSNDHIPDPTKMINETPRTDAAEYESQDEPAAKLGAVDVEFARQLERELNIAQERINRLEEENDALRADLLLWGDNLRLQDRIKRLEEENDALRADLLLWRDTKP